MKKIRKLTALLLAFSATFAFATACFGDNTQESESSTASQTTSEETSSPQESESTSEEPSNPEILWSEWELVTEPDCTKDGVKQRFDLTNPSVTETAPIPARGHDYSGENNTCIRCEQALSIPALAPEQTFPLVEPCTHTDLEIYEGQCDCTYQGRGEEYSRLELTEGCYTVETVSNGEVTNEIWLSFFVQSAGQYMLYSIDNDNKVTAARYDASAHFITPVPYAANVKDGDFYSYVSCSEQYFNAEWRATYCLKATAGTPVKICFVKVADAAWARRNVITPTYPTEINGKRAPEAPAHTKAVEVAYDSEYYYSDPAFGGDGYYHVKGTDAVIYAAIDSPPTRLLLSGTFTTVQYDGSALNLQDGYTADGDYRIRFYVPFIMNCADDNDIFNTELAPDLNKNCYQNYCNSDGMYPVNKELFKFLNLYVQHNKPIDSTITVEEWQNKEDWLWLSACYTYKSIVVGTKENPRSLELGENEVNLPLYDYLYCNLKADGVYTIACDTEKVFLSIGQNTVVTAPFAISVDTSIASPIEFTLSTSDGKAATATVTVTQTVGASNGLGSDDSQTLTIDSLGELTLQTITIYGENDTISYYAYYVYTAEADGTLCLTVIGETTASVFLAETYTTEGEARLDVAAGDTVIVYVSSTDTPVSVTVEMFYLG